MKCAVPHMREQGGGAIVNISSVQALRGFHGWAAYAAAKGGINALTQQAAVDLAPDGIRVNAVAPGTIMTPLNEKVFRETADPAGADRPLERAHPLGRFGAAGGGGRGRAVPRQRPRRPSSPATSSGSMAAWRSRATDNGTRLASREGISVGVDAARRGCWRGCAIERGGAEHRAAAPGALGRATPRRCRPRRGAASRGAGGRFLLRALRQAPTRRRAGAWLAGERDLAASARRTRPDGSATGTARSRAEAVRGRAGDEGGHAAAGPSGGLPARIVLARRRGRDPAGASRDDPRSGRRAAFLLAQGFRRDAWPRRRRAIRRAGGRSWPCPQRFDGPRARSGWPTGHGAMCAAIRSPTATRISSPCSIRPTPARLVGGGGAGGRLRVLRGEGCAAALPDVALDEQRRPLLRAMDRRGTCAVLGIEESCTPFRRRRVGLGGRRMISTAPATARRSTWRRARSSCAMRSARFPRRRAGARSPRSRSVDDGTSP